MIKKILVILFLISLRSVAGVSIIKAQLLKDSTAVRLVKKNIDCIYNLQFDDAKVLYSKICKSYPGHPVIFLIRGMMTYWKDFPLLHNSVSGKSFETDMNRCIELSEKNSNPDLEAEYLLSDLCSRGMLLLYYSDNDLSMKVFPLAISTYPYIRKSFAYTSYSLDLFYFTGIYNYYRDAYPSIYPVYKPLAGLFPAGDMRTGKRNLYSSATSSVVMGPESYFMLAWIYLNFENDYTTSLKFWKLLHEKYPGNIQYLSNYIKNLLLLGKYQEAEELISSAEASNKNKYFEAQLIIYKGILNEKKYLKFELAKQFYNKGIDEISAFGDYGNEYAAYAYFGLSRISQRTGEKIMSKSYRNAAMKLVDFKKINFD